MIKVHNKTVWLWSEERKQYALVSDEYTWYNGIIESACGASAQQTQISQSQQSFMNQLQAQSAAVFGNASSVFQSLQATFAPTVAAGPSQQGFSPQQLSNLNSEAITQTGQAYKNAKEAVGEQQSSVGGGNTPLPSGTQTGEDLGLAESGANQTASELGQITQANYQQGNANYNEAVAGLENAPNVFNSSTGEANAATNSGNAAANTANQIASQNNSWVGAVTGLAGALGGAALGNIGGITSALGGGNTNTNSNGSQPGSTPGNPFYTL